MTDTCIPGATSATIAKTRCSNDLCDMVKKEDIIRDLQDQLEAAVKAENFEAAASLRDRILAVESGDKVPEEEPVPYGDDGSVIDLPISLRSVLEKVALKAAGDKRAADVYHTYLSNKNELQLEWGLMNLATVHMGKMFASIEMRQAKVLVSTILGREPNMFERAGIRVTQGTNPITHSPEKMYWFNGVAIMRVYTDPNGNGMVMEQMIHGSSPPEEEV